MNHSQSWRQRHHIDIVVYFFDLYPLSSDPTEVPNFFLPSHRLEASMRAIQLAASFRDSLSDLVSICQPITTNLLFSALLYLIVIYILLMRTQKSGCFFENFTSSPTPEVATVCYRKHKYTVQAFPPLTCWTRSTVVLLVTPVFKMYQ